MSSEKEKEKEALAQRAVGTLKKWNVPIEAMSIIRAVADIEIEALDEIHATEIVNKMATEGMYPCSDIEWVVIDDPLDCDVDVHSIQVDLSEVEEIVELRV